MSALPVADSYWEGASSLHRRSMLALLAYAAGDAYGFQSEFIPPLAVEQYDSLPPHWSKVVERYPDVRL